MKKIYIVFLLFFCLLVSCAQGEEKEVYTFYAMDTIISITFYNTSNSKELAKSIEDIYLKYEAISDDFIKKTGVVDVCELNEIREADVSTELVELLEFSLQMKEDTMGYFNPFIGRLSHLWKDALENGQVLEDSIIQSELKIMNETYLDIEGLHVSIQGKGNLDLGGLAKGYATNLAKEFLDSVNCKSYLLNAGSSNLVLGNKNGNAFVVGLSKALESGYYKVLTIQEKAIVTSSIKEQNAMIDGKVYSHLLNPMTGYPADYYDTLSIIGDNSMELDAYSTACFAMDIEMVKSFLDERNLDYILSKNNQILYESIGVEQYA